MSETDYKKFWFIKLPHNFFNRHDIKIIESMPNGKDYCLFYLKLLLESITHNGELRFNETLPYDENMLSVVTNTNVDVVRSAMKILKELNLIELLDDQTIFMTEVNKMIGVETGKAIRMREYRERQKELGCSNEPETSRELELEKDIDKEIEKESTTNKKENINIKERTRDELKKAVAEVVDKYQLLDILTINELKLWIDKGCTDKDGYPVEDIEKYLINWSSTLERRRMTEKLYGKRNN